MEKILIIKGIYKKTRITNSVLPLLKPLDEFHGNIRATVDASSIFGEAHKVVIVEIEDYKLLN